MVKTPAGGERFRFTFFFFFLLPAVSKVISTVDYHKCRFVFYTSHAVCAGQNQQKVQQSSCVWICLWCDRQTAQMHCVLLIQGNAVTHFPWCFFTGCRQYPKIPHSTSTSTTVSSTISTRASFAGKQKVRKVGSHTMFADTVFKSLQMSERMCRNNQFSSLCQGVKESR